MRTFNDLYTLLVKNAAGNDLPDEVSQDAWPDYDAFQLDCLLHPQKHPPVWQIDSCDCQGEEASCVAACIFKAIRKAADGKIIIDNELCVGCSACIDQCKTGKLTESRDILPVLYAIKHSAGPVYAMIAPAFIGQFNQSINSGKLRSAFKKIGFSGMVEVALFADILTLKEALEFDRKILYEQDFMITSCCCPVWIAMIRKIYHQYIPHLPGSVSPMVASGRSIKLLEPKATTVFVGPCVAKKAEAHEADIADAVDFVLTFQEMQDIFDAFEIDLAKMEEDSRDHSSQAGRSYARTGGVSKAVQDTVSRLNPNRKISVKAQQADGVPACMEIMNLLRAGKISANFLEGMGCVGGCVGGPKAILSREEGRDNVDEYARLATHFSPIDNPFVPEMLEQLGLESVESLLDETDIFTRHF